MSTASKPNLGWGITVESGAEFWDAPPIFVDNKALFLVWLKLIFYPKKFHFYRRISWLLRKTDRVLRLLDVGMGTGGTLVELKALFGDRIEVFGVDPVSIQVEVARQRLEEHGFVGKTSLSSAESLPFADNFFDLVYSSDVLGHVKDPSQMVGEIARVLRPCGELLLFAETIPGRHAFARRFFLRRGVNIDPHRDYHISLLSQKSIKSLLSSFGLWVCKSFSGPFGYSFLYPEEVCAAWSAKSGRPWFVRIFCLSARLKNFFGLPVRAVVELVIFLEMLFFRDFFETQGLLLIARKSDKESVSSP